MRSEHGALIWIAPLQTCLTTAIGTAAGVVGGLPILGAAILGLGIALSSSVVIVNITRSRRRTTNPDTERALPGWSVLQDITGVTLGVVILAGISSGGRPLPIAIGGMALFVLLAAIAAAVLPRILRALRPERDLFLIVSVAMGLAIAGIGSVIAGIPLALAAFVAGLAITEGPDSAEARRRLLPFRDLLAVLFFVAIGTLIDPGLLARGLGWLVLVLVLVVLAKGAVAYGLSHAARLHADPLQLAIGLGQVGEFSFVLASVARAARAIGDDVYAAMLASVIITIVASTVFVRLIKPAGGHLPDALPG